MMAVLLAVVVLGGSVVGNYTEAQAADLSAGALQYGLDLSFLESLFMAGGASLGLDMLLKTQNDINNWDWGDLLDDPLSQKQIDDAEEKIGKLYYGATEAYKKTHGSGSKPTPTPMITDAPAPGITPPVTVAPINPDDLDIPEDWGTLKKNATENGVLAMGAATAYCVKEAVKGWWDDLIQPEKDGGTYQDNPYVGLYEQVGYVHHKFINESWHQTWEGYYYIYNVNGDCKFYINFSDDASKGYEFGYNGSSSNYRVYYVSYKNDSFYKSGSGNLGSLGTSYTLLSLDYTFKNPYYLNNELQPGDLTKSSLWPSTDLKDDYDNNRSPNFPELVTPTLRLPTLDEIKDLWKQGTDDEENRPTYVTNFITNHTVQATPTPEPTKKPDVQPTPTIAVVPDPGGGTDPDPEPTPSTTPAVNPDPGGGTDPQPSGSPDPNPDPDPGGGGSTDPDNPETPTPEQEASPYKADLKEIFPFCIPFDLIHLLKAFDAEAEAPVFEFPLDIEMDNPWTGEKVVDYHHTFELDMSDYEEVIKILRIFQVIFFIIALMLITRQQMIKG